MWEPALLPGLFLIYSSRPGDAVSLFFKGRKKKKTKAEKKVITFLTQAVALSVKQSETSFQLSVFLALN